MLKEFKQKVFNKDDKENLIDQIEKDNLTEEEEEEIKVDSYNDGFDEYTFTFLSEGPVAKEDEVLCLIIRSSGEDGFTKLFTHIDYNMFDFNGNLNVDIFDNEKDMFEEFGNYVKENNIHFDDKVMWTWDQKDDKRFLRTRFIDNNIYKKQDWLEDIYFKSLKKKARKINKQIYKLKYSTFNKDVLIDYLKYCINEREDYINTLEDNKVYEDIKSDELEFNKKEYFNLCKKIKADKGKILTDYVKYNKSKDDFDVSFDDLSTKGKTVEDCFSVVETGEMYVDCRDILFENDYQDYLTCYKLDESNKLKNKKLLRHSLSKNEMKEHLRNKLVKEGDIYD